MFQPIMNNPIREYIAFTQNKTSSWGLPSLSISNLYCYNLSRNKFEWISASARIDPAHAAVLRCNIKIINNRRIGFYSKHIFAYYREWNLKFPPGGKTAEN